MAYVKLGLEKDDKFTAEHTGRLDTGISLAHERLDEFSSEDVTDSGSTGRAILRASSGSAARDELGIDAGTVPVSAIAGTDGADVQAVLEDLASRLSALEAD